MSLQELLLEGLIVFLQCDLNVVYVCGGGDFVRMRERFDDLGQTLEVSIPRLGLGFLVPCCVHGKCE